MRLRFADFQVLGATLIAMIAGCGGTHADPDPTAGKTPTMPTQEPIAGSAGSAGATAPVPSGMPQVGSLDTSQGSGSATKIHGANWNVEVDPDANTTGAKQ